MTTVIAKSRTISNGQNGDATPVEENFVELYENDQTLATDVTTLQSGNTTISGNKTYSGTSTFSSTATFSNTVNVNSSAVTLNASAVAAADGSLIFNLDGTAKRTLRYDHTGDRLRVENQSATLVPFAVATPTGTDDAVTKGYLDTTRTAVRSDMETATSTTAFVSPGVQQYHPCAAKAWVNISGSASPTIRSSYNVSSLVDDGTGQYTVNMTNAMASNTAYTVAASGNNTTYGNHTNGTYMCCGFPYTAGAFRVTGQNSTSNTYADFPYIGAVVYGALA